MPFYKVDLVIKDPQRDTDVLAEYITMDLENYDIYDVDVYEIRH